EYDAAQEIVTKAEAALDAITTTLTPEDADDRTLLAAKKYLFDQKERVLEAVGVSFVGDVAPILNTKCSRCHGMQASGGLNLNTFASIQRGGRSGLLLTPGSPTRSLIMAKLIHPDDAQRMPRGAARLSDDELLKISIWIKKGAKFDAQDADATLADLIRTANRPALGKVEIPKPSGTETVSFTKDIAPFMVNLCVRCHSGNTPASGLDLTTFEKMMEGGDSGRVIIPGNVEGSRMFRLVGGLENPRMPANNQARITRQNYDDFKKWFEEGNKFDGDSIKTPLRDLVPSVAEARAEELAKLTDDQWLDLRLERTEDQWKRTLPKEPGSRVEGEEFLVWGNVSRERLTEINTMAEKNLLGIKTMFSDKSDKRTFNGRLAIMVFKDRLGYEEFNLTIERRRPDASIIGHTKVTDSLEDAYVVLEDLGDDPAEGQMNFETNLVTQLSSAYLQKSGTRLPDWVSFGTGLYLAARSGGDAYFKTLPPVAAEALTGITQPEAIFAEGAFSPGQSGAVGYTLVTFLIKNGGAGKFGQFVSRLKSGSTVDAAFRAIYRADATAMAIGYSKTLPQP
ncbi:MAG TPA: c-type cytochrome domain-containing protein, partial [Planctomycetaceae bacterium]|nr:c-type cytochrome domain-containing protein [Planctomycetaceae bacterium]